MTVRDPADRLEGAFRAAFGVPTKRRNFGGYVSLASFVDGLRRGEGRATRALNNSFASPDYRFEDGGGCCDDVAGELGYGSNFLTAQVDYLAGLTAEGCDSGRHPPIYFLCTERLDADLAVLYGTSNRSSSSFAQKLSAEGHRNARIGRFEADSRSGLRELYVNATTLSASARAFVRDNLYALDTTLHAIACGGGPTSMARRHQPGTHMLQGKRRTR